MENLSRLMSEMRSSRSYPDLTVKRIEPGQTVEPTTIRIKRKAPAPEAAAPKAATVTIRRKKPAMPEPEAPKLTDFEKRLLDDTLDKIMEGFNIQERRVKGMGEERQLVHNYDEVISFLQKKIGFRSGGIFAKDDYEREELKALYNIVKYVKSKKRQAAFDDSDVITYDDLIKWRDHI